MGDWSMIVGRGVQNGKIAINCYVDYLLLVLLG